MQSGVAEWQSLDDSEKAEWKAAGARLRPRLPGYQAFLSDWIHSNFEAGDMADLQEFDETGTWTKPAGAKFVMAELWAPGGGAGSGRRGDEFTARIGGEGGTGGTYVYALFAADDLDATEEVEIGDPGEGGEAQTSDSADGNDGSDGGNTTFAGLTARGGKGGKGGSTGGFLVTKEGPGTIGDGLPDDPGGFGGAEGTNSAGASAYGKQCSGWGGACGAIFNTPNTTFIQAGVSLKGGHGGGAGAFKNGSNPSTDGSPGAALGDGTAGEEGTSSTPDGGNGSGRASGGGGFFESDGGDGGTASGGGGGGPSDNGNPSGEGGNGGPGLCRVYTW
jgi:hypothetical protein